MVDHQDTDTASHQHGFSPFVCACFTLNYIIGTGFLALPWAFQQAGLILSAVTMAAICFVANTASDYILTAMARAATVATYLEEHSKTASCDRSPRADVDANEETFLLQSYSKYTNGTVTSTDNSSTAPRDENADETTESTAGSLQQETNASPAKPKIVTTFSMDISDDDYMKSDEQQPLLQVEERKFELTELCQIFLGDAGLKAYGIAVSLDIYGFLWAYTSVFGSAMANAVPLFGPERDCYPFYVFVFAAIVVPMSFMELSEQTTVQVFLSGCRIVMILLMVCTPVAAAVFARRGNEDGFGGHPHFDTQIEPEGAVWFDFSNVQEMIPVLVFSVLFHQAVPGLADEATDKSKLGTIFGLTFLLCGSAYTLIGILDAWYFGGRIRESCNINWQGYHGGTGTLVLDEVTGEYHWVNVALWARAVSFFVVCFPALDVISTFPLNAFVLGNSLMGIVYRDNIHEVEHNRRITTFYRAVAAIPPIIGALFVRNLGVITDYSGLSGLAIAFCFPALLYIYSEKKATQLNLPSRTLYERFGSSMASAKAMFIFGVVSIVYCFLLLTFRP